MKVALAGETGFVGSHILAEVREHDDEVTALVRNGGHRHLLRQTNRPHAGPREPR